MNDSQRPISPDTPGAGSPNGDVSGEVPHKASADGPEHVFSVFR